MAKNVKEFDDYKVTDLYLFLRSQKRVWDMRSVETDSSGKEHYPIAKDDHFFHDILVKNKHFTGSIYVSAFDLQYTYDHSPVDNGEKWRKYLSVRYENYVPECLAYLEAEKAKWQEHKRMLATEGLVSDFANNKLQELENIESYMYELKKDKEIEKEY